MYERHCYNSDFSLRMRSIVCFFVFVFCFFGCVGSLLLHAGFFQLRPVGATLRCSAWASHCGGFSVAEHGFQARRLQQLQHVGSVVAACGLQQLWRTDLVALRHVGSSQTRDRTHVPCIDRRILNHCITKEVPIVISFC